METEQGLLHENQELRQRLCEMQELLTRASKAEDSLKAERRFTSALLDTVKALVVVLDRKGRIIRFNQACEETTGYSFAEVRNKPFWDIFLTPEEASGAKDVFHKILLGHHSQAYENYWVTKEGHLRRIAWSNTPLLKDGQVELIIKSGIDITEREQAERHIAHLATFPQLNPNPVLEIDLSGRIVFYNTASLKILEGLGMPGRVEAFLPTDLAEIQKNVKESGSDNFRCEVEIGNSVFEERISFPSGSNTIRIYAWDVTERKRAEEALRESEGRFRSLFENMIEGVALHEIIYDDKHTAVDYRILATNPSFTTHTGLDPEQIRGRLASTAYGTGEPPYLEIYAKVAETGQPAFFKTFFQPLQRYFSISATSPKPGQFVTVFRDITAQEDG